MAIIVQNGISGKICSRCRIWKPLNDFPRDRTHGSTQGGRHCRCKMCHSEANKQKRVKAKK